MDNSIPVVWVKFSAKIDPKKISTAPFSVCPMCGEERIQRWGKVEQTRPDNGDILLISRFRCAICGHTFSDPAKQNLKKNYLETVQVIAGMIWALGISLREIEDLFQKLDLSVSRSSIWRYGKRTVMKFGYPGLQAGRFLIDPIYIAGISEKMGVVIGLELTDGRQVVLGTLSEHNPKIVKRYLEELIYNTEIEIEVKGEKAISSSDFIKGLCPFLVGRKDLYA